MRLHAREITEAQVDRDSQNVKDPQILDENEHPFVSIVMPVRNETDFIQRAIRSILENNYPASRMEVIVADGDSDDGTPDVVSQMAKQDSRIILLKNEGKIVSTGLNLALKRSKGDIFIRIDGHCEIPSDFIRKSVQTLLKYEEAWVAGGYWKTVANGYIGKVIAAATQSPLGVGNAAHRLGNYDGWTDTVPYGAHHKWVLDKIGYFDESLVRNQDDDFNMRIRLAGGKIRISTQIWSAYYSRASLKKLWRQYFQYGFWRIRTIQKHGRPAAIRQVAPVAFVLSLIILFLLSFAWKFFFYLFLAEIAIYVLGLLYGIFDVARQLGIKYALASPLVFMMLHFGYGFGCLLGFVRFIVFRNYGLPRPEEFGLSR